MSARHGGVECDLEIVPPRGGSAVLVGGDAKAMNGSAIDETRFQVSLIRFFRAREIARDPDGPSLTDGVGAIMAFPAGTNPLLIARFEQPIGRQNVVVMTPPAR